MNRLLFTVSLPLVLASCTVWQDEPLLRGARDAERWIGESTIVTTDGIDWPVVPNESTDVVPHLYSGSPGVVLFLLELHRVTGDARYVADARRGADHLVGLIREVEDKGFYTGIAGIGSVLLEMYEATEAHRYRAAVHVIIDRLATDARALDRGVEWSEVSDIISESAGIGLFLLDTALRLNDQRARALAFRCGERLLDLAHMEPMGLRWDMSPGYPRDMPNFSHGTAGVAFFLARLFEETEDRRFLEAAIGGTNYLTSISDNGGLVCHHVPGGEQLFYLGWCHGPAGTLRLYHLMARLTGKEAYADHINVCANTVLQSGIPSARTEGFWNNVGQCCGSAGVAEFFVELYAERRDLRYLAFAERLADDVLARATSQGRSRFWIQAEHRVEPDLLQAQTGYMQGASGIGMMLLHLREAKAGRFEWIRMPDSPFGSRKKIRGRRFDELHDRSP